MSWAVYYNADGIKIAAVQSRFILGFAFDNAGYITNTLWETGTLKHAQQVMQNRSWSKLYFTDDPTTFSPPRLPDNPPSYHQKFSVPPSDQ